MWERPKASLDSAATVLDSCYKDPYVVAGIKQHTRVLLYSLYCMIGWELIWACLISTLNICPGIDKIQTVVSFIYFELFWRNNSKAMSESIVGCISVQEMLKGRLTADLFLCLTQQSESFQRHMLGYLHHNHWPGSLCNWRLDEGGERCRLLWLRTFFGGWERLYSGDNWQSSWCENGNKTAYW